MTPLYNIVTISFKLRSSYLYISYIYIKYISFSSGPKVIYIFFCIFNERKILEMGAWSNVPA